MSLALRAVLPVLACVGLSCGAGDRPAPYVPSGRAPTECGSVEQIVPNLLAFLRSDGFAPLAQVLEEDIVPSGALRTALSGVLRLAKRAPPPPDILTPFADFIANDEVDPVVALAEAALRYITGEPRDGAATESHYEVTTLLGNALTQCERAPVLFLGRKLISTHLPLGCTPLTAGCRLGTVALFEPMQALFSDPALRVLLTSLSIESVPEESFVTLMRQIFTVLKSPSFNFSDVRSIIQSNVYPLIADQALRVKIDDVLSVLDQMTRPELGVQTALREAVSCLDSKDPNAEIARMLYGLVVQPEFAVQALVAGLAEAGSIDPEEKLAQWLVQIIDLLLADDAINDALIGLIAKFLVPQNAERLLPMMLALGDAGVTSDVVNIVQRADRGCSQIPSATPSGPSRSAQ